MNLHRRDLREQSLVVEHEFVLWLDICPWPMMCVYKRVEKFEKKIKNETRSHNI